MKLSYLKEIIKPRIACLRIVCYNTKNVMRGMNDGYGKYDKKIKRAGWYES